ncbi:MAG: hypothetical protein ACK5PF_05430 [bacterium]|jgi:hypothetical protein
MLFLKGIRNMTKGGGIYFWRVGQVGGSFYVTRIGKMQARTVAHRAADVAFIVGMGLMGFCLTYGSLLAAEAIFFQ